MNAYDIETDARRLYSLLLEGGVGLALTRTGYGLVAMKPGAVKRIYQLKGRPAEKPCVTVGTLPILADVAAPIDAPTRAWLARAIRRWPMAVIARQNPCSRLLSSFDSFMLAQCTKAGTIATFYGVGDLIARVAQLAYDDGRLVVGSSANLAGTGNNYSLDEVPESIRSGVDLVFDYGRAELGSERRLASTILDLTTGQFQRRGVCFADVERSWRSFRHSGDQLAGARASE
jgi:tRNA A37 threonylcarbamoyladenosine synthetase subunit TsaC/SUA5/YrdC